MSSARSPRFVFITDVPPARETAGRFAWLLFAANNRPLARSAAALPSLPECRSAAHRVRRAAPTDELAVTQSVRAGRWLWAAALEDAEAVCVHAYLRRVECSRAAALFRRAVEDADPDSADVRCFGPRTLRAFDAPVLDV